MDAPAQLRRWSAAAPAAGGHPVIRRSGRGPRPVPLAALPALPALLALLSLPAVPALPAPARAAGPDAAGGAISVSVRAARERCFTETVRMAGHLVPREPVDVVPEREGLKIAQILAAPLDAVTAGQPLARLVPIGGDAPVTVVAAPVSGTVLRSQGAVGQPVSPRQGPLFRLAARGEIEFVAQAPLAVLGRVAAGQTSAVRALDASEVPGRVRLVEPGADPADQAGRVKIALASGPQARIGTFARGIVTVDRRCGLGVPHSAIQYDTDGTVVRVVNGDRIETRQVTVGLVDGADAEIRSGLTGSDLVVVRAGPFLREGDRATPIVVR